MREVLFNHGSALRANDQLADKTVLSWNTYSSRSIVQT
jgi:hypothetical protein